jgi:hypothetical protein
MNLNVNNSKPFQPKRQVNLHHVADMVNIDNIIDYNVNTHDIGMNNDDDDVKAADTTIPGRLIWLAAVLLWVTFAMFLRQNRNQTRARIKK